MGPESSPETKRIGPQIPGSKRRGHGTRCYAPQYWIEFRVADRADDAADGEVVCLLGRFVLRITLKLARSRLRRGHVFSQRLERVAAIKLLRFDNFRTYTRQRAADCGLGTSLRLLQRRCGPLTFQRLEFRPVEPHNHEERSIGCRQPVGLLVGARGLVLHIER
jgi:hypothetical protein